MAVQEKYQYFQKLSMKQENLIEQLKQNKYKNQLNEDHSDEKQKPTEHRATGILKKNLG